MYDFTCLTSIFWETNDGFSNIYPCDPTDEGTCDPEWPCDPELCNPGP